MGNLGLWRRVDTATLETCTYTTGLETKPTVVLGIRWPKSRTISGHSGMVAGAASMPHLYLSSLQLCQGFPQLCFLCLLTLQPSCPLPVFALVAQSSLRPSWPWPSWPRLGTKGVLRTKQNKTKHSPASPKTQGSGLFRLSVRASFRAHTITLHG